MSEQGRFPYETNRWGRSPKDRRIWLEELERRGVSTVKAQLAQHGHSSQQEIMVGIQLMVKGFAEDWLAWHEAEARREEAEARERREAPVRKAQIDAAGAATWSAWAAIAAAIAAAITAIPTIMQIVKAILAWKG